MDERPPFDPAFWLILIVVAVYALVILGFSGACIWWSGTIITHADIFCDPSNRLMGLLAAALAAALTYARIKK